MVFTIDHADRARKRPGSPPLSQASKRHRSTEMASEASDNMSLSAAMWTTRSMRNPSLMTFSGTSMPTCPFPAPSGLFSFSTRATATSLGSPALGQQRVPNDRLAEEPMEPAESPPVVISRPVSHEIAQARSTAQRTAIANRRHVNELMERASSPPVALARLILPETAAAGRSGSGSPTPVPSASPAPGGGQAGSSLVVHGSDSMSSQRGSPFSEASFSTPPPSPSLSFHTEPSIGTPPPRGAAPRFIQGLNKHELFEVVHPETLHAWEAVRGPKVVVFIANDTITKEMHHRVTLIRKALKTIFPDADMVIGSPEPVSNFPHDRPVYPFLVHNLSEIYAHRLIVEHCWTINNFTFFALDFSPPTTPFVMTLTGLNLPARPQSNNAVVRLIRHWLLKTRSVASFIQKHNDNLPPFLSVDEQIEFVMATIDVSPVKLGEGEDSPVVFNAYLHPPTHDSAQHCVWQREIRAITYFADCGTGKAASLFYCDVCKGRDHPTASCLFPPNISFQNSSAQTGVLPAVNADCGARGEGGVHVSGINFNYFMRM